jgi:hypothetical protein
MGHGLGRCFEDDNGLVRARNDGFRNGNQLSLLIEDAQA